MEKAMTLRLEPEIFEAIVTTAQERSMSAPALAAEVVTQWVLDAGLLPTAGATRLRAQGELLKWVEQLARQHREADDWDEHITRDLFAEIARQKPELYAQAIQGGQKTQLNREIGALVRKTLGAEVREQNGQRLYGQLPRGEPGLIKTYTQLYRPSDEPGSGKHAPSTEG